jgi:Tfp pilus assembly protein PilN
MIEFNLLPDVKVQYLRTKRTQHLIITLSAIVGAASFAVFLLLFLFVDVGQKVRINQLDSQISSSSAQLTSNKNLNQILTVQNQLETIPTLEAQAPTTSRLFGYLSQVVPANATISSLAINFSTDNVTISGGADTLATVNTLVDTLKYTTYNDATTKASSVSAFKTVVLSSFGYSGTATNGQTAQYSVAFNFDPILFKSTDSITLVVPSETTTRSILNQPQLFKASPS